MGEALELARQALATYSAEVSPATAGLKKMLDGPTGMSLIEADERAKQLAYCNYQMVTDFADLLPAVNWTDRGWYFRTRQQSEAKFLQASILWRRYNVMSWNSATEKIPVHYPYYVIGRQRTETEPQALLLVAAQVKGVNFSDRYNTDLSRIQKNALDDAPEVNKRLFSRALTAGQLRTYDAQVQSGLGQPYTPDEADHFKGPGQFYNRQTGEFTIQGESPGSIAADAQFEASESSNSWLWNIIHMRAIHRKAIQSASCRSVPTYYDRRLPIQQLINFDVLGKMGQLATMFGVVVQTDELFRKNPALSVDNI